MADPSKSKFFNCEETSDKPTVTKHVSKTNSQTPNHNSHSQQMNQKSNFKKVQFVKAQGTDEPKKCESTSNFESVKAQELAQLDEYFQRQNLSYYASSSRTPSIRNVHQSPPPFVERRTESPLGSVR